MPHHGEVNEDGPPSGTTRSLSTVTLDTRQPTTRVVSRTPSSRRGPPAPERIGRFRILEELGRGGMGVVYRAEDPRVGRVVALKLLTSRRDDLDARLRMRREAQALAQLSHPNVVQVFDSGIVDDQVYIAMELVAGQSLRGWSRTKPRSLPDILDAYEQAAVGLAAAHARGLVHRDFKPANAIMGDDGRVRVLDFGLARALPNPEGDTIPWVRGLAAPRSPASSEPAPSQQPQEPAPARSSSSTSVLDAPLTAKGARMGTPAYMAPELHLSQPATAASDQFAWCVALYETVYGWRPFGGTRLKELTLNVVRGQMRPEPEGSDVPGWLRDLLHRGLRPAPQERWPSMEAVLAELRSHAPTTAGRRRAPTIAIALGLAALAAAAVLASSTSRCPDADPRFAGVWDDARRGAVRQAFLATEAPYATMAWERVEARLDSYAARWQDAYLQTCSRADEATLDRRMACLEQRRQGLEALTDVFVEADPGVVTLAVSAVGELDDVERCLADNQTADSLPEPRDPDQAEAVRGVREQLARILALQIAGKYEDAARRATQALAAAEDADYPPLVAEAALRHGLAHFQAADYEVAEASLERAYFAAAELGHAEVSRDASSWLIYVSGIGRGNPRAALRWAEHARAATEGREDLAEVRTLTGLAMVLHEQGEHDRARVLYEQALAIQQRTLPSDSTRTAATLNQLGMVLAAQGLYDEAIAYHERALASWVQTVGPYHPKVAGTLNYRGFALDARGDSEASMRDYQRALEIWRDTLGPDHPDVGVALANIGVQLRTLGRPREALEYYQQALSNWEESVGPEHLRVASLHLNIAQVQDELGLHEQAVASFRRVVRLREQALGPTHEQTLGAKAQLEEALGTL